MNRVAIIGGGVIGLSTAIQFAEAGLEVSVIADKIGSNTDSVAAGAIWLPAHLEPQQLTRVWSYETFVRLTELLQEKFIGLKLVTGRRLFDRRMGLPWWSNVVPSFEVVSKDVLPESIKTGFQFSTFIAYMPDYLSALVSAAKNLRVNFKIAKLSTLAEAFNFGECVVNCSGLGSRELVCDSQLTPKTGYSIERRGGTPPGFSIFSSLTKENFGCFFHGDFSVDVIEHEPLPEEIDAHRVRTGDRPCRPAVRVEAKKTSTGLVVHNYGHCQNGFTLSWGVARAALNLVLEQNG